MARPNLLLITTDQQRFDALGVVASALGRAGPLTPHLDWLADTGTRFSRCYVDCPICGPSRQTIMTGRPDYLNRATERETGAPSMASLPTLPALLTRAGYQTRAIGKMHFHPMRAHYGFEHVELPYDMLRAERRAGRPTDGFAEGLGQNEMTPAIRRADSPDLTRLTGERCIEFLETRDETRPFFLWASFGKPHPPLDPGPEAWELYADLPLGEAVRGDWSENWEAIPPGYRLPTATLNMAQRLDESRWRLARRAYFALITEIDQMLGRLFSRLRERNLLADTWIVFASDHGEMLGDHGLAAKQVMFDGAIHVPLIVRAPGDWDVYRGRVLGHDIPRGGVDGRVCTLADLMPTLLAAAGLDAPGSCVGQNLAEPDPQGDRVFIGHHDPYYAVQADGWRLHWCAAGGETLLFNLDDDPRETRDRAADPEAAAIRARLEKRLSDHLAAHAPDRAGLKAGPAPDLEDARTVRRWPGFHTEIEPCDTLH